jgi:TetR/AcrR family transcriptional repressor of nem operon
MARPREFNEDDVLNVAGELFWAKGYQGTSTRDLAEETGLTPSSIYSAFGDKRGLYLRALEQYIDRTLRKRIARLESSLSPGRAIANFFDEIVDRSLSDHGHRGCLLVNTALESTADDTELQHLVANETIAIEHFFRRCITAGLRTGEIATDDSPDEVAKFLLSVLLGLRVLARVRPDPKLLKGLVGPALKSLNLAWPPRTRSVS